MTKRHEVTRDLGVLRGRLDTLACSDHDCRLLSARRGGMGTNGGCHCHRDRTPFELSQVLTMRREQVRLLTAQTEAVNAVLAEAGCSCDCEHDNEGHEPDCDRCVACRVDAALRGGS